MGKVMAEGIVSLDGWQESARRVDRSEPCRPEVPGQGSACPGEEMATVCSHLRGRAGVRAAPRKRADGFTGRRRLPGWHC
jgi:hypothetical protein